MCNIVNIRFETLNHAVCIVKYNNNIFFLEKGIYSSDNILIDYQLAINERDIII